MIQKSWPASADLGVADAALALAEQSIAEDPTSPEESSSQPEANGHAASEPGGRDSGLQDDWELINGQAGTPGKDQAAPPNPAEGAPVPGSTPPGAAVRRLISNEPLAKTHFCKLAIFKGDLWKDGHSWSWSLRRMPINFILAQLV